MCHQIKLIQERVYTRIQKSGILFFERASCLVFYWDDPDQDQRSESLGS